MKYNKQAFYLIRNIDRIELRYGSVVYFPMSKNGIFSLEVLGSCPENWLCQEGMYEVLKVYYDQPTTKDILSEIPEYFI